MVKFIFWILTISIIGSVSALSNSNNCDSVKHKVLDPNLGLGKISCIDTGEYSRSGCRRLRKDGNLVCKLTPLDKPQGNRCYHMQCTWKEQDNYNLSWEIKPPYDTIRVTMTPELDMSPAWTLFWVLIALLLWLPLACANPELAFIACLFRDRDTRYGSDSKLG